MVDRGQDDVLQQAGADLRTRGRLGLQDHRRHQDRGERAVRRAVFPPALDRREHRDAHHRAACRAALRPRRDVYQHQAEAPEDKPRRAGVHHRPHDGTQGRARRRLPVQLHRGKHLQAVLDEQLGKDRLLCARRRAVEQGALPVAVHAGHQPVVYHPGFYLPAGKQHGVSQRPLRQCRRQLGP